MNTNDCYSLTLVNLIRQWPTVAAAHPADFTHDLSIGRRLRHSHNVTVRLRVRLRLLFLFLTHPLHTCLKMWAPCLGQDTSPIPTNPPLLSLHNCGINVLVMSTFTHCSIWLGLTRSRVSKSQLVSLLRLAMAFVKYADKLICSSLHC